MRPSGRRRRSRGDAAEDAADQAAGRGGQQIEDHERGERPGRQAVEGAGRRHGAAGHPRGDVAAGERGDDARDEPPDGGGDREGRGGGVVAAGWVERYPDPDAEHRQQDLDDQRLRRRRRKSRPATRLIMMVGVVVDGGAGTGRGRMRAGRVVRGRSGLGVLGQRLEPLLGYARVGRSLWSEQGRRPPRARGNGRRNRASPQLDCVNGSTRMAVPSLTLFVGEGHISTSCSKSTFVLTSQNCGRRGAPCGRTSTCS